MSLRLDPIFSFHLPLCYLSKSIWAKLRLIWDSKPNQLLFLLIYWHLQQTWGELDNNELKLVQCKIRSSPGRRRPASCFLITICHPSARPRINKTIVLLKSVLLTLFDPENNISSVLVGRQELRLLRVWALELQTPFGVAVKLVYLVMMESGVATQSDPCKQY